MLNLSDQMRGEFLLLDANLSLHLDAIKLLLKRNQGAEADWDNHVKDLKRAAEAAPDDEYGQYLSDMAVDAMHASVYHDAVHSMAAVGTLAPLIESLLAHLFRSVGSKLTQPTSGRRSRFPDDRYWDVRWYAAKKESDDRQDLARGFEQLATETGLLQYMPPSCEATLNALFAYRNNMFHNGLEWPETKRQAFTKRIECENWGDWFTCATTNGDPWIFYMKQDFVDHCIKLIDELVLAVGRFHRKVEQDGLWL